MSDFWPAILALIRRYHFDYLFIFLAGLVLFGWLNSVSTLPEPDSFYHAKMAVFLSEGRIVQQFPWLQETPLKEVFVDHHFLYHLLLAPFTVIFNPLLGVKIATILLAALLVTCFYWFLKQFQIKLPALFTAILVLSQPWLFRASLVKAPVAFFIIILLFFYFLAHRKNGWLFFLAFAGVWFYGAWPLLPAIAILYAGLALLIPVIFKNHRSGFCKLFLSRKKSILTSLATVFGGCLSGLIINPYFPANLKFYWQQIVEIALVNYHNVIGVGGEWYPYPFIKLLTDTPISFVLLIAGLLLFIISIKRQSIYAWTFGILTIVFLLLTLKSKRQVEFFAPLAVLFAAFSFSDFKKKFFPFFWLNFGKKQVKILSWLFLIILLPFIINAPFIFWQAKKDLNAGWNFNHYQAAADWLKNNAKPEQIVFNADWDDFPFLFYYNSANYYLTGLDPTFMYQRNEVKYWQYVNITLGKNVSGLAREISESFGASYVFLDKKHEALERNLSLDAQAKKVYEDNEALIYQLNTK